jgi:hypothetical protein
VLKDPQTDFTFFTFAVFYGILKHRHARGYITVDNGKYVDIGLFIRYDSYNYILEFNTSYAERSVCMYVYVCV